MVHLGGMLRRLKHADAAAQAALIGHIHAQHQFGMHGPQGFRPLHFLRAGEEGKVSRHRVLADDPHLLAHFFQRQTHGQAAAQGIPVGAHMGAEHDLPGLADVLQQAFPVIDRFRLHGLSAPPLPAPCAELPQCARRRQCCHRIQSSSPGCNGSASACPTPGE